MNGWSKEGWRAGHSGTSNIRLTFCLLGCCSPCCQVSCFIVLTPCIVCRSWCPWTSPQGNAVSHSGSSELLPQVSVSWVSALCWNLVAYHFYLDPLLIIPNPAPVTENVSLSPWRKWLVGVSWIPSNPSSQSRTCSQWLLLVPLHGHKTYVLLSPIPPNYGISEG